MSVQNKTFVPSSVSPYKLVFWKAYAFDNESFLSNHTIKVAYYKMMHFIFLRRRGVVGRVLDCNIIELPRQLGDGGRVYALVCVMP